jgi:hypothetical protein
MAPNADRASPEGPARHVIHPSKGSDALSVHGVEDAEDLAVQLARRREAALRLPPLACGCHDPEIAGHLANRCRYPRRAA